MTDANSSRDVKPSIGDRPPVITAEMRVAARTEPGSRLYIYHSDYAQMTEPPWAACRGWFPVDGAGEIGDFEANRQYNPMAALVEVFEPQNELENVLCLYFLSEGREGDLISCLRASDVLVHVSDDEQLLVAQVPDAADEVLIYSSERRVPDDGPQVSHWSAKDVIERAPSASVARLDPGSNLSITIPMDILK